MSEDLNREIHEIKVHLKRIADILEGYFGR